MQHFSAKESFGRPQNKCITCLQRTVHCIHLNNLCPCFCAGILLSRSFDARDAPNKPYFQRKLTDSLSNIFNALPAIFCTAEVLSLLLLRKLQLHSITAIRKLKCTNPLKKQPAVNAAHKGFGTQNTPNATAFCSNAVSESESSALKRMRTQPASRREGTQLSRKVNEMPPSFLKLNSPFRTPFRTFFSLPHMMFILCFWPFLQFGTQNTPNPTRFCTFAPFSGLER